MEKMNVFTYETQLFYTIDAEAHMMKPIYRYRTYFFFLTDAK